MKIIQSITISLIAVFAACSTLPISTGEKMSGINTITTCILPEIEYSNTILDDRLPNAIEVADREFENGISDPCKLLYRRIVSQNKKYFKILYLPQNSNPNYDLAGGDVEIWIDRKSMKFVKGVVGQ